MNINKKHLQIVSVSILLYIIMVIMIPFSYLTTKPVKHVFSKEITVLHDEELIGDFDTTIVSLSMEQPSAQLKTSHDISTYVAGFNENVEVSNIKILSIVDKPPEFSEKDIALIARVTMSEASTQSFEVQVAVAQTVINRVHSGDYGDTVSDVVYSPSQFSTADNGDVSERVMLAVKEAIDNSPYPDDMLYFRQWYYHEWANDYKKIGDLYFSLSA